MAKRWYELSPDVCILIGKIEMAHSDDRTRYARKILTELRKQGYVMQSYTYMNGIKNYSMKRWYDNNRETFLAFEYLKDADSKIQQIVVKDVLAYMNSENILKKEDDSNLETAS